MFVCVFLKVKNINLRILSDRLNVEIVVKKNVWLLYNYVSSEDCAVSPRKWKGQLVFIWKAN